MKRVVVKTGGRPIENETLIELQSLAEIFEKFIAAYAVGGISTLVVISGCTISPDRRVIDPGIMLYSIEGKYRFCTFDGVTIPEEYSLCYLYPVITDITDVYENLEVKPVFSEYKVVASLEEPESRDIFYHDVVEGSYMPDFLSLIQNSSRLFVTQLEKNTWNGKANAVHTHTASQITESSTKRFVTDAEKVLWNAARSAAVSDVLGGISATWNTLQKLKTYTDTELSKKLNGTDVGVDWQEIDDLDPGTIGRLKYRRDAFGYVYLWGAITAKSTPSGYTLPEGFRPITTRYFYVVGYEETNNIRTYNRGLWVKVNTDGRVTLCANDSGGGYDGTNSAGSYVNGISFLTFIPAEP